MEWVVSFADISLNMYIMTISLHRTDSHDVHVELSHNPTIAFRGSASVFKST